MAKSYRKSGLEIQALTNEVLEMYHGHLLEQNIIIDLIDCYEHSGKPAVMHHGHPAFAVIRVMPLKDRSMGRGDAEITFDARLVASMSRDEKMALIDHELHHLEIKRNKDGEVVRDDLNRTEYKMRHHDREFGWFDVVASRWGRHSIENKQAMMMFYDSEFSELYLSGREKQVPPAPDQPEQPSPEQPTAVDVANDVIRMTNIELAS